MGSVVLDDRRRPELDTGGLRIVNNGSVTCPYCQRNVVLRKDGTLWRHQKWMGRRSGQIREWPPACDASGMTYEQAVTVDRLNRITPEFRGRVRAAAVIDDFVSNVCATDSAHGPGTVFIIAIEGEPFNLCPDCGEKAVRDRLRDTTDLVDVEVYR